MNTSHEGASFPMAEHEHESEAEIIILAQSGLGFGEGTISTKDQLERGELTAEALEVGLYIIMNDPEVFGLVDHDAYDDGCGDGRPVSKVFVLINSATGKTKEYFNKSRRRAKLFGGGLIAASSMWRNVSGGPTNGETVLGDREFISNELKERGIMYGAHTDSHAEGENCGCGAIDKYPEITRNVLKYRQHIEGVLRALYGESYEDNESAIVSAFGQYETIADNQIYFSNADGQSSMDFMLEQGAVVKQLDKNHMEDFVVMNDIEGTTFDQRIFDSKLKERGIAEEVQVFAVDTWRGRMYADAIADIARRHMPTSDLEAVRKQAYADFLIRTLAVSATLTKGDQPVVGRVDGVKSNFSLPVAA